MPVPYNFSNNSLNSRRNRNWFARYRVVIVFGVVALITLIIVLCITNCGSDSSEAKAPEEKSRQPGESGGSPASSDNGSSGNSGSSGSSADDDLSNAQWYKNEISYVVKRGDMLARISRNHHSSERSIIKLNNISNPNNIRIGQKLRIIPGPWRMAINTGENSLTLLQKEKIYTRCQVECNVAPGEYTLLWRQQQRDSAARKKGEFYLLLRSKKNKYSEIKLKHNVIQKLLYLIPGGIPVTVSGNK